MTQIAAEVAGGPLARGQIGKAPSFYANVFILSTKIIAITCDIDY